MALEIIICKQYIQFNQTFINISYILLSFLGFFSMLYNKAK